MDRIVLDSIYHASIYAFVVWGLFYYIPVFAQATSSTRVFHTVTSSTESSSTAKLVKKIVNLKTNTTPSQTNKVAKNVFCVVLIDIETAANEKRIHCVKKPFIDGDDEDLNFVALSYRWGEVTETLVDTHMDYLASITSFHLDHFYQLCKYMRHEPDLKDVKYVWVDAICINQANYDQRKATILHMNDIYKRANYILAVPDLNLHFQVTVSKRNDAVSRNSKSHGVYIYHLIQDNVDALAQLEEAWFDGQLIPANPELRQMLASTFNNFVDGLMSVDVHRPDYSSRDVFQDIQQAASDYREGTGFSWNRHLRPVDTWPNTTTKETTNVFNYPYQVLRPKKDSNQRHSQQQPPSPGPTTNPVPFAWLHLVLAEIKNDEWKDLIRLRNDQIKQSLLYLMDLIIDWSSRVWVVSEYSIASTSEKTSGKIKYWFMQLDHPGLLGMPFFEFDFSVMKSTTVSGAVSDSNSSNINTGGAQYHPLTNKMVEVAQSFRKTLADQLREQSFLEKLLLSKAMRNEDRFLAIFPLVHYYKRMGLDKDTVSKWKITNLESVKLKLYEIMATEDKLELLFLSRPGNGCRPMLPTFATQELDKNLYHSQFVSVGKVTGPVNFKLEKYRRSGSGPAASADSSDAILLIKPTPACAFWTLCLKPTMYYTAEKFFDIKKLPLLDDIQKTIWSRLDIHIDWDKISLVCIPMAENGMTGENAYSLSVSGGAFVQLLGSFEKKKWIVWRYYEGYMVCATFGSPGAWSTHRQPYEFIIY